VNLDFIPAWANTIAQFEGFNSPGNRAARNNNPGDLKYAGQSGAIGADSGGFAVFPDPVTGFQALYRQLQKYVSDYPNFTILDITAHYLGQSTPTVNAQGDAFTYAAAVASSLGVDIGTTLAQLASGGAPAPTPAGPVVATGTIDAGLVDGLVEANTLDTSQIAQFSTGELLGAVAVLAVIAYIAWSR
jgi:hypothetical protein